MRIYEYTKCYADFIEEYRKQYEEKQLFQKLVAEQKRIAKQETIPSVEAYILQPNSMQRAFIYNLLELWKRGMDKALLISATGTGKTYASAFAMRELGFKRDLFLVHRNQIARQAKASFERVFGSLRKELVWFLEIIVIMTQILYSQRCRHLFSFFKSCDFLIR